VVEDEARDLPPVVTPQVEIPRVVEAVAQVVDPPEQIAKLEVGRLIDPAAHLDQEGLQPADIASTGKGTVVHQSPPSKIVTSDLIDPVMLSCLS
jgi:hypothetical protein